MRKVSVQGATSLSSTRIWNLITDLSLYPKHVKFVKKIYSDKPLSLGTSFSDITTIVYIPLKITHTVNIFEKGKRLGFFVKMPVYGFMKQSVEIKGDGSNRILNLTIEFDFQNKFFDFIFGKFLEKRVREMLLYILDSEKKLHAK